MEFEDKALAAWLEDTVRKIMEEKADSVAFVAQLKDGVFCTAYFNAGPCRKMEFASHIQIDAVLEAMRYKKEENGEDG